MNASTTTSLTVADLITAIDGLAKVTGTRRWTQGAHDRLYIDTDKANGGRTWNRGVGYAGLYVNLKTGAMVRGECAGAKTRDMLADTLAQIEDLGAQLANG